MNFPRDGFYIGRALHGHGSIEKVGKWGSGEVGKGESGKVGKWERGGGN